MDTLCTAETPLPINTATERLDGIKKRISGVCDDLGGKIDGLVGCQPEPGAACSEAAPPAADQLTRLDLAVSGVDNIVSCLESCLARLNGVL